MSVNLTIETRINELAARQHGVIARGQLIECGVSASGVEYRVRIGRLTRLHRGVYRVGPLMAPFTCAMAALLAAGDGAAISYASSARAWRVLSVSDAAPVDVTVVGRRVMPRAGIRIHHVRVLPANEVTTLQGLVLTTPARTMVDLAAVLTGRGLERAVAEAFALGILDRPALVQAMEWRIRGRGVSRLRRMLSLDGAPAWTRSEAEERFLALVRRAGLQAPAVNHSIAGYNVDFYWRTARLVVEVDGFRYHGSERKFETDRRRDAALAAAGLRVMRVTWKQITEEHERLLVNLVRALGST